MTGGAATRAVPEGEPMRYVTGLAALLIASSLAQAQRLTAVGNPALAQKQVIMAGDLAPAGHRVTIKADQAPLSDVLKQLEDQTGTRIYSPFRNVPEDPMVSVEAQDASLRAVLREIAAQCGCYLQGGGTNTYILREGDDPRELAPSVVAGPYTLRLRSVSVNDSMTLDLMATGEQPLRLNRGMVVSIEIEADDDLDLARIYALHPAARAVDDRGRVIAPKETELPERYGPPRSYSHQWWVSSQVQLAHPGRQATSIASLEGDLLVYEQAQHVQLVLPLDDPQARAEDAGCALALVEAGPKEGRGYAVTAKLTVPPEAATNGTVRSSSRPPQGDVRLETADGTRIGGYPSSMRGGGRDDEAATWEYEWAFQVPADQTPVRMVYSLVVAGGELETLPYKFENVLLPTWQE